jgi:hypothetical protein
MSLSDFVTFTRQDGHAFSIRAAQIAAYMPAADVGTLVWMAGAAGTDFQHVKDSPAVVARALGVLGVTGSEAGTPKSPKKPRASQP